MSAYGRRPLRPAPMPKFSVHLRRCGRRAAPLSAIRSRRLPQPRRRAGAAGLRAVVRRARGGGVAVGALRGAWLRSAVVAVSDEAELDGRVRPLFAEFVAAVMEGEAVRGCRKRVAALAEEIEATEEVLRRRNKIGSFVEVSARKEGLRREKDLVERKLEEFRSAMGCVMGIWMIFG